MSLKRKELVQIYEEVRSRYKRKERDKEIVQGIDVLYQSIINYIDGSSEK